MMFTTIALVAATLALTSAPSASGNALGKACHRTGRVLVRANTNALRHDRADQAAHGSYYYKHGNGHHIYGQDGYDGHGSGYIHHPYL